MPANKKKKKVKPDAVGRALLHANVVLGKRETRRNAGTMRHDMPHMHETKASIHAFIDGEKTKNEIKSILERSNLDEFLLGKVYEHDDTIVSKKKTDSVKKIIIKSNNQFERKDVIGLKLQKNVHIPMLRPPKNVCYSKSEDKEKYIYDSETISKLEAKAFSDWRLQLSKLESNDIILTPYEKNIKIWKNLWEAIEHSDILVVILDARHPLFFYCESLENYIVENKKTVVYMLNKADLVEEQTRLNWYSYFKKKNKKCFFFSAHKESNSCSETPVKVDKEKLDIYNITESLAPENDKISEVENSSNIPEDTEQTNMLDENPQVKHSSGSNSSLLQLEILDVEVSSSDDTTSSFCEEEEDEESDDIISEGSWTFDDDDPTEDPDLPKAKILSKKQILDYVKCVYIKSQSAVELDKTTDVEKITDKDDHFENESYDEEESVDISSENTTRGKQHKKPQSIPILKRSERIRVGFIGYPNVGKSSTINAICGKKTVSVSKQPGETLCVRAIEIPNTDITLVDCPGLVFPQAVSNRECLVIYGVSPVDHMCKNYISSIQLICDMIPDMLLRYYKLNPDYLDCENLSNVPFYLLTNFKFDNEFKLKTRLSAFSFLNLLAVTRKCISGGKGGIPNLFETAKKVLKDFISGNIYWVIEPPSDSI